MKSTRMLAILVLALGLMVCPTNVSGQIPLGTAFTYQGFLMDKNNPADDLYDFKFSLYNDPSAGSQEGDTIVVNALDVNDGYFAVDLDFGGDVFTGDARWLDIEVRSTGSGDPCTPLYPRVRVTLTPYALYALSAEDANKVDGHDAGNAVGQVAVNNGTLCTNLNADKVDGKHASDFVQNGAAAGGDLQGTYPNPTVKKASIPQIETGSYTGNGIGTRDIAVSFTPSAVIVFDTTYGHLHTIIENGNNVQQGGLSPPFSSGGTLGTNKFTVGDDKWSANQSGYPYHWIAFKAGG